MNRSRKDIAMMFAMGALLLFAVFNFVYKPQRSQLSGARSDLQRVEQSITDAKLTLQAPTTTSLDQAESSSLAIPQDPAISNLLRQLQAVADDTGVALASISPTPLAVNPSGPGGSLQLSITASGSHTAVQGFLQQVRDLDRLMVIEQIGVTSQVATELARQTDQLQLAVRVFTLQPPATAPIAAPTPPS